MMLTKFDYRCARTVEEALELWAEAPGSRYLAGGTDLLPQMRSRLKVARVVDVKRIAALGAIHETPDGDLAIGAAVTMTAIATDERIRDRYPALVQCVEAVGAYPLRNRATLAGNVCNASPAADTAAALLCLDARLRLVGPAGKRELPVDGFFLGPGRSAQQPGELLTEIVLPASSAGRRASYQRLARRGGMDLATLAVLVTRNHGHRVALVAVAPTPLRARGAEAILDAEGPAGVTRAAEAAMAESSPITDIRGSAEYRREMVGVLTARGARAVQ